MEAEAEVEEVIVYLPCPDLNGKWNLLKYTWYIQKWMYEGSDKFKQFVAMLNWWNVKPPTDCGVIP